MDCIRFFPALSPRDVNCKKRCDPELFPRGSRSRDAASSDPTISSRPCSNPFPGSCRPSELGTGRKHRNQNLSPWFGRIRHGRRSRSRHHIPVIRSRRGRRTRRQGRPVGRHRHLRTILQSVSPVGLIRCPGPRSNLFVVLVVKALCSGSRRERVRCQHGRGVALLRGLSWSCVQRCRVELCKS